MNAHAPAPRRIIPMLLVAAFGFCAPGCSQNPPGSAGNPASTQSPAPGTENGPKTVPLSPPAQSALPANYRGIDEHDGRRDIVSPPDFSPGFSPGFPPGIPGQGIDPRTLSPTASGRLACRLLAPLRTSQPGNLFYSPRNVQSAMMLAYEGARGETAAQIARVLGVEPDQAEPQDLPASPATPSVPPTTPAILIEANRIWPSQGEPLRAEFIGRVKTKYSADIVPVNFVEQAEAARREINDWTAEQTRDRIRDLLPPGAVDSSTRMVLTSAIYFQADWLDKFDKSLTQNSPFLVSANERVEVPLMQQELSLPQARIAGAQIVEIPYVDARYSMLVLLPDQVEGLPDLEGRMTPDNLTNWTRDMKVARVQLSLPRFQMTVATSMTAALKSLGVTQAFQSDADFSGMSDAPGLFLSQVVHKAFVSVDENGTEAAAATGMAMVGNPAQPIAFRADHPFLFLIRDRVSHDVLFVGCLVRPE